MNAINLDFFKKNILVNMVGWCISPNLKSSDNNIFIHHTSGAIACLSLFRGRRYLAGMYLGALEERYRMLLPDSVDVGLNGGVVDTLIIDFNPDEIDALNNKLKDWCDACVDCYQRIEAAAIDLLSREKKTRDDMVEICARIKGVSELVDGLNSCRFRYAKIPARGIVEPSFGVHSKSESPCFDVKLRRVSREVLDKIIDLLNSETDKV